jgi:NAD(P)-dependent dehydrogenase (short-subunit alcohol dehydrogenase family)
MRLSGKIAVVTGAASGFGRATAELFAKEGARVVVADRDAERAEETARLVQAAGSQAEVVVADIATPEGADLAIRRCLARFEGIDILVNNAGIADSTMGDTWNVGDETWDRILRVNLKSVFLCSRAAINAMLPRNGGSIVSVASIAASSPVGGAAYAASKGGIRSYTIQVARELAKKRIRVNCVSPGYMRTPMSLGVRQGLSPAQQEERMAAMAKRVPMGREGAALDIANAILYLASDDACYVTGQELVVDGGYLVR